MKRKYDVAVIGNTDEAWASASACQKEGLSVIIMPGKKTNPADIADMTCKNPDTETYLGDLFSLTPISGKKLILTSSGPFIVKAVIMACGSSPRRLGLPGESSLDKKNIAYDISGIQKGIYDGRTVAIAAGNLKAAEAAISLGKYCSKVFLLYETGPFGLDPHIMKKINLSGNIILLRQTVITELICDDRGFYGITVADKTSGNPGIIYCDSVIVLLGDKPNNKLCRPYIMLDEEGRAATAKNGETNVRGIYAVGPLRRDFCRKENEAAAESAAAAQNIKAYIDRLPENISV